MAEKKCRHCGRMVSISENKCPHCGKSLSNAGLALAIAIPLVICLFVFAAILASGPSSSKTSSPQQIKRTPAQEHLRSFQIALRTGELATANMHFNQIPKNSPEYKKASEIYTKTTEERAKTNKESKKIVAAAMIVQRQNFVDAYERQLLDQGMDVYVSALGKTKQTLKVKWVLVSRPLVYKMINNPDFVSKLRELGFKKLIMTDGYNDTWSIDL
jgi:hypothetical protein